MNKLLILLFTCIIIIDILGTIFLVNHIRNSEDNNAQTAFDTRVENTMLIIQDNITGITNEALSVGINIENILGTSFVDITQKLEFYRDGSNSIFQNNKFNIPEIYIAYLTLNQNDANFILTEAQNMYQQPNMYIYDFDLFQGIIKPTDNITFPKTPMFVITPPEKGPGVPAIGMPNLITAAPQIETIFQIPDLSWDIPISVLTIDAIGRDVFRTNIFIRLHKIMMGIGFIPFDFLNNLILNAEVEGLEIIIKDSANTLFNNNNLGTSIGTLQTQKIISYYSENWILDFAITQELEDTFKSDASLIIIIAGAIISLVIILFILMMVVVIQKSNDLLHAQHANLHAKRVAILNQNTNHILHEIRNALSMPYIWFQNNLSSQQRKANNRTLDSMEKSINDAVHLSSNILDFEKLISLNYQPKYSNCNFNKFIIEHINDLPVKYLTISIESDIKPFELIAIDQEKTKEIIGNALVNAVTHSSSDVIKIRISSNDNYVVFEIINQSNNFDLTSDQIEKLFIPFFVKSNNNANPEIWQETIDKVLTKNDKLYQSIKPIFSKSLTSICEIKPQEVKHKFKRPSTSLGLSICRIISKSLGGDCGIDTYPESNNSEIKPVQNKINVRFWVAIKYNKINSSFVEIPI